MTRCWQILGILLMSWLASGCPQSAGRTSKGMALFSAKPRLSLTVLSGSENKALEPLLEQFTSETGISVKMGYKGSVDIMLELEQGAGMDADAVWPANSLWIALGDKYKVVKHSQSIMRSPVVLGVKQSVAQRLGWVGRDVRVEDLLAAAEGGKLRFCMTSATQSNSGASAYFGYLYAFAGQPEVLTAKHLADAQVRQKIKRILGAVDRSSGSSGWLKDLFLAHYDSFDAMVNYEAIVIEANQDLVHKHREPLYAVYPVDGLAIADSPLGYVDKGDKEKEDAFLKLQEYLLNEKTQQGILRLGRRVGLVGLSPEGADPAVFNPDWGIDLKRTISPIRFPAEDVLRQALDLYQVAFRKPSCTVYALDFSGSMEGEGEQQLKQAMHTLLDQEQSKRYMLQPTADDITIVIPFDDHLLGEWSVRGNDPQKLQELYDKIDQCQGGGGTNIYGPVAQGLKLIQQTNGLERHFPAVILMTDGQSNEGSLEELQSAWSKLGLPAGRIPVFAITFGSADEQQLKSISDTFSGKIFDGKKDLVQAFREAKGYN